MDVPMEELRATEGRSGISESREGCISIFPILDALRTQTSLCILNLFLNLGYSMFRGPVIQTGVGWPVHVTLLMI